MKATIRFSWAEYGDDYYKYRITSEQIGEEQILGHGSTYEEALADFENNCYRFLSNIATIIDVDVEQEGICLDVVEA